RECGIRSTLSFFFKKLHEEMHEGCTKVKVRSYALL
ncbi:uncharacterized protein METZ01_LOCUS413057, partial [marine metagenome]